MKTIYVVAGEASGDQHGAALMRALKKQNPSLRLFAAGGAGMRAEAPEGFVETAHLHATGLTEVLKLLPQFVALMKTVVASVRAAKPDLVVMIDNPGFNLRLARRLLPLGIPMAYYICPQIWAWKENRIHFMKRAFKKALVVFDFEQEIYRKHGMPVAWVGHPLAQRVPSQNGNIRASGKKKILILPGSRKNEVSVLLPILCNAAQRIFSADPNCTFELLEAPTLPREYYDDILLRSPIPLGRVIGDKYDAMASADLGLVCSGTATLECALMGLPMIVVYRASWLTYVVARLVAKVRFLSLPNLLAGRQLVPELLQYDATPDKISTTALSMLRAPDRLKAMRSDLSQLTGRMGTSDASETAAAELLQLL